MKGNRSHVITTVSDAIDTFGVDVLDHLDRQVAIPVHAGAQRQGDVLVLPRKGPVATVVLPLAGFPVVRGEAGGNTHLLLADGPVTFDTKPATGTELTLGVLSVPAGSTAYLTHPEHGYVGIAPGRYVIRRQREQADELRLVAD